MSLYPVILSGGSGKRLWPLSRSSYPKQFLALNSCKTMLQETVLRLEGLDTHSPTIICNKKHSIIAVENVHNISHKTRHMLIEPIGRNTAPAITTCALKIIENDSNAVLLVLPSDHVIKNYEAFHNAVRIATCFAHKGYLVTFGVKPTTAHIGYGYLECGDAIEEGYALKKFKEKPNKDTAQKYINSGKYFWNSGIFCFKAKIFLDEIKQCDPEIFEHSKNALNNATRSDNGELLCESDFVQCPDISIDYAIMEHTQRGVVVPLDAGWKDIGSWGSLCCLHKERMLQSVLMFKPA